MEFTITKMGYKEREAILKKVFSIVVIRRIKARIFSMNNLNLLRDIKKGND